MNMGNISKWDIKKNTVNLCFYMYLKKKTYWFAAVLMKQNNLINTSQGFISEVCTVALMGDYNYKSICATPVMNTLWQTSQGNVKLTMALIVLSVIFQVIIKYFACYRFTYFPLHIHMKLKTYRLFFFKFGYCNLC